MRTLALRAHRPQIYCGKDSSDQRHQQEAGGNLPLLPICCRSQRQIQSNPFLLAEVCLVDPVNPAPIPLNSALKYVYHIPVDNRGAGADQPVQYGVRRKDNQRYLLRLGENRASPAVTVSIVQGVTPPSLLSAAISRAKLWDYLPGDI